MLVILEEATGATEVECRRALDAADGDTKTAIVSLLADTDVSTARAALGAANRRVREALAALGVATDQRRLTTEERGLWSSDRQHPLSPGTPAPHKPTPENPRRNMSKLPKRTIASLLATMLAVPMVAPVAIAQDDAAERDDHPDRVVVAARGRECLQRHLRRLRSGQSRA